MKLEDIKIPVGTLQGVGPAAVKLFANLNVFTIGDLLSFFPRDYDDRTKIIRLADFKTAPKVHTVAKVIDHEFFGYGKMKTLKIIIHDGSAQGELIAFNRAFLEKTCPIGSILVVSGAFQIKYGILQSTTFEVIKIADPGEKINLQELTQKPLPDSGVLPIYPLTEGLSQKNVRKAVTAAIKQCYKGIDNELPEEIIKKRNLLDKKEAIRLIHEPEVYADVEKARYTLIYEELFNFQAAMAKRILEHKHSLPSAEISENQNQTQEISVNENEFEKNLSPRQIQLLQCLPFKLTEGQINAVHQMNLDIDKGFQDRYELLKTENPKNSENCENSKSNKKNQTIFTMSRLLQGDVGSGKTLTAFLAALRVIDLGGQVAFMAPTELLSRQHAENAARQLEPLGVRVAFLTGSLTTAARKNLLKQLKEGNIDILIGTHALFSNNVIYKDLQFVIIDEQHRFGVMQRNAIISKGLQLTNGRSVAPHLLMMSATPIPQTLALTVFGDLDVSVIKTMPKGRKPITTYLVAEGHEQNAYNAVRKELEKGRQAYFVYPAIEGNASSENDENTNSTFVNNSNAQSDFSEMSEKSLKAAQKNFENLSKNIYPNFKCALLHSKIDEDEQVQILNDFRDGKIQVLVATTVIEVGVDVPNATCMVIEQADHFGLAQLHQLRGRVGRGSEQSFCFLIYSQNLTKTGIERMKALRQTTDGFELSEIDLKLRGPGELAGTIQAGNLSLGIADIHRDQAILLQARQDAFQFMQHKLQDGSIF